MAPFDQSRQLLHELPGEKRSISYEKWLKIRGKGGQKEVGQRDGDDGGGNKNKKGGDGNGKKNQNNNSNANPPPAAASLPPTPTAATFEPTAPEPEVTPAPQPQIAAEPAPVVLPDPAAVTTTTTTTPLTIPTATPEPPSPTFPTFPPNTSEPIPEPTTTTTSSTTPVYIPPTTTSTTPYPTTTSTSFSLSTTTSSSIIITTTSMSITATPVVTSITSTTTEVLVLTATGSSQRKSDKPHDHNKNGTSAAEADMAGNGVDFKGVSAHSNRPLSPQAEEALIAVGIIAGFIIFGFLIYLFVRVRRINIGEKFDDFLDRYPRFERIYSAIPVIGKRQRWSRRSSTSSPSWDKDDSRTYSSTPSSKKSISSFYVSGSGLDEKPKTPTAVYDEKSTRDTMNYEPTTYGMTDPASPLHVANPAATMSFYNTIQPPANTYTLPNAARMTRMTRMSELSSLSSGFGDAQIDVPESGPTNTGTLDSSTSTNAYNSTLNSNAATMNTLQPYRQSFMQRASRAFAEPLTSRFSWTTANQSDTSGSSGQRDTMYTTTSEDSAPRFRTIHSWVNQQSSRVEKGKNAHVPSMPPLPPSQRHLRAGSESPAFRQHPGDQVDIATEPARIESVILDRKLRGSGM